MPIYEYCCTSCGKEFEEWVKGFDASEHEPCPVCGADAIRMMSRTSFVLEGSGWYVTDYGNRKSNHESGAGAPNEGHDASNADSESQSEPATASSDASAPSPPSDTGASTETVAATSDPHKASPSGADA